MKEDVWAFWRFPRFPASARSASNSSSNPRFLVSIKEDKGKYDDSANVLDVFENFKNPKDKGNKDFYKDMKMAFKNNKDASIGNAEDELDSDVEVTEDDSKVDIKQIVKVK